jgi:hypothetical protein
VYTKTVKLNKYNEARLPDTFKPAVEETNKGSAIVNIHYGKNMDIIILVAKEKQLSKDNLSRIKILVEE